MALTRSEMSGFPEVDKVLKELADVDAPAARRVARESLMAAARPVTKVARAKARRKSGRLRRSIGAVSLKRKRGPVAVAVGPRRGRWKGFHGHLVEFGHLLVVNGRAVGRVRAYPFMRPAWDAEGGRKALTRYRKEVAPRLSKHVRKTAAKYRNRKARRR